MPKEVFVFKRDGTRVPYSEEKLRNSLKRVNAGRVVVEEIVAKVERKLYDGMTTKELFGFVFKELKKYQRESSYKYNLKNAIIHLGHAGYVFEKFIGKLFECKGYKVKLNQMMPGKRVSHEIDVNATKGNERIMIECKHHSKPWLGTHIEVALAVYARFLDLKEHYTVPMLVTNTKFTSQVIRYAEGAGLRLMGWKYPKKGSLEEEIEKHKMYPVTILEVPHHVLLACINSEIILLDQVRALSASELSRKARISIGFANNLKEQADQFIQGLQK